MPGLRTIALEQANFCRKWQGSTPNGTVRGHQLTAARAEFAWLAAGSSVVQQGAAAIFAVFPAWPMLAASREPLDP
jgi:hypothetical protein